MCRLEVRKGSVTEEVGMAAMPVEEIPVREQFASAARLPREEAMEAIPFGGPTRPFSLTHDWYIDPDTFATHFDTNRTHASLKAFLVLKRIHWLLRCHRKISNSYRKSYLFSIEPRDAGPADLRINTCVYKSPGLYC